MTIIMKLNAVGYKAYTVGGCVRDLFMGRTPHDWDITTSATPEQVKQVFANQEIIETGIEFGTVTLRFNDVGYEITTFRKDGRYSTGHRPDDVYYTNDLYEDLSRRDFTMNAIAYHPSEGIIDPFDGRSDIANCIIACVGDAEQRFEEDPLRILRALRFVSVFGFVLSPETERAAHIMKDGLSRISAERIGTEFSKILMGNYAVQGLMRSDIIAEFIPEIIPMIGCEQNNPHHYLDVWKHTLQAMEIAPYDLITSLAIFFHDIGKPLCKTVSEDGVNHFPAHAHESEKIAGAVLRHLKYSEDVIKDVTLLIHYHDSVAYYTDVPKQISVKRLMNKLCSSNKDCSFVNMDRWFALRCADIYGQKRDFLQEYEKNILTIRKICDIIINEKRPFGLKDLAINGKDLINFVGMKQGQEIGIVLYEILEGVINETIVNDFDTEIGKAKEIYGRLKGEIQ